MPGQHSPDYQRRYQAARARSASWVRKHLPSVFAAARGEPYELDRVRVELRTLADDEDLEMP